MFETNDLHGMNGVYAKLFENHFYHIFLNKMNRKIPKNLIIKIHDEFIARDLNISKIPT